MTVFKANFRTIEKHNKEYEEGKHTWYMGVNHFTDLTHEEFMKLNQVKIREMTKRKHTYKMEAETIADAVDWRTKVNFITRFRCRKKYKNYYKINF